VNEDATRDKPAIRVLVTDDHAMMRRLVPDVVLLDVDMPLMGAEEVMRLMMNDPPEDASTPRVVIVTMHDEPRLVRELVGLGASAYLVKSASMGELISAVRRAAQSPVGPDDDAVMVVPPKVFRGPQKADGLTERELEVLLMAARGMSNDQIAGSLYISGATAKRHLANIFPKIGASSRAEAVRIALAEEWISPRDITGTDTNMAWGGPAIHTALWR